MDHSHQNSQRTMDIFDALVVDSVAESRGKLKQTAMAVSNFRRVNIAPDFKEALTRLNSIEPCDVIFINFRFGQSAIAKFIQDCKQTRKGKECAFILVLRAHDQDGDIIALNMISGADGFLFEPYSAEGLRESSEIAARVKLENEKAREIAAMQILVTDVVAAYTKLTLSKSLGRETNSITQRLRELNSQIKNLGPEAKQMYHEVLIELLCKSDAPRNVLYKGVSKRLKARLEEKLIEQLEAQYELKK